MSDADVSEEVIVYGDAPSGGGGGTDVISIPADFYYYYAPTGPYVINPPTQPGGGGGGGDVDNNPCEDLEAASEALFWAAVGLAIVSLSTGAGEVMIAGYSVAAWAGVGGVTAGVASHQVDKAADDPPQPDYARPPLAPPRTTSMPVEQAKVMAPLLNAERQARLFVDTIECAQGAFLAADPPWVQRHTLAATGAYVALGNGLLQAAETLEQCWAQWTKQLGTTSAATKPTRTRRVLESAADQVGLDATEAATIITKLEAGIARAPQHVDVAAALAPVRRVAQRLSAPAMINARFAFPKPPGAS
jgi:hypothetical protein